MITFFMLNSTTLHASTAADLAERIRRDMAATKEARALEEKRKRIELEETQKKLARARELREKRDYQIALAKQKSKAQKRLAMQRLDELSNKISTVLSPLMEKYTQYVQDSTRLRGEADEAAIKGNNAKVQEAQRAMDEKNRTMEAAIEKIKSEMGDVTQAFNQQGTNLNTASELITQAGANLDEAILAGTGIVNLALNEVTKQLPITGVAMGSEAWKEIVAWGQGGGVLQIEPGKITLLDPAGGATKEFSGSIEQVKGMLKEASNELNRKLETLGQAIEALAPSQGEIIQLTNDTKSNDEILQAKFDEILRNVTEFVSSIPAVVKNLNDIQATKIREIEVAQNPYKEFMNSGALRQGQPKQGEPGQGQPGEGPEQTRQEEPVQGEGGSAESSIAIGTGEVNRAGQD